jgi:hypothetical protein
LCQEDKRKQKTLEGEVAIPWRLKKGIRFLPNHFYQEAQTSPAEFEVRCSPWPLSRVMKSV